MRPSGFPIFKTGWDGTYDICDIEVSDNIQAERITAEKDQRGKHRQRGHEIMTRQPETSHGA
jgi:hypothetical protein